MNRSGDIEDEIIMIAFAPVKFAPVSKLDPEGEVFIDRPVKAGVAEVEDLFFQVPAKSGVEPKGWSRKSEIEIPFGKSSLIGSAVEKSIRVNVKVKGRHKGRKLIGKESVADADPHLVKFVIPIVDGEIEMVVDPNSRVCDPIVPDIRLNDVRAGGVIADEVRVDFPSIASQSLANIMAMRVI